MWRKQQGNRMKIARAYAPWCCGRTSVATALNFLNAKSVAGPELFKMTATIFTRRERDLNINI